MQTMKEVIYKGEDAVLGRFGFVKKGDKLEVNDKEFGFIKAKSADQFDFVDEESSAKQATKDEVTSVTAENSETEDAPAESAPKRTRRRSE